MAAQTAKQKAAAKVVDDKAKRSAELEASNKEVSQPADFKKTMQAVKVQLPSGNVCLARPMGIQPFIEQGLIPNSLMPIVTESINEGTGMPTGKKLKDLAASPEMMKESMDLANAVVMRAVIDPVIHPAPESEADRDDALLYVDELDLDDKMFVFQWVVGGTRDLERFRKEQADAMAHVADGQEPVSEAK